MPDCVATVFVGRVVSLKITKEPFVVRTQNSTYRLGRASRAGRRTIRRLATNEQHGQPLEFTRCIVLKLAIGDYMQVKCLDGPAHFKKGWHTSRVISVEKVR